MAQDWFDARGFGGAPMRRRAFLVLAYAILFVVWLLNEVGSAANLVTDHLLKSVDSLIRRSAS